jgi:hypothetical protein
VKNKKDKMKYEGETDIPAPPDNQRRTFFGFVAKMYLEIIALLALLIGYIIYAYLMLHNETAMGEVVL